MQAAFRMTLGVYYLALGVWLGSTVMMGISAGGTFATLREEQPSVSTGPTSHPALADRTADYLAGEVVWGAFEGLAVVQIVCALAAAVAAGLQCGVWRDRLRRGGWSGANLLRLALLAAAVALLAVDLGVLRPHMSQLRQVMYDLNVTAAARHAARQAFDFYHGTDTRVLSVGALLAAGAALATPFAVGGRAAADPHGRASAEGSSGDARG